MERLELFESALEKCRKLQNCYPDNTAIQSIIRQIEYLIQVESGATKDSSRLKDIIIGVQSVREIAPLDKDVAKLLYEVSFEAQLMKAKYSG